MRKLWEDHVTYTGLFAIAAINGGLDGPLSVGLDLERTLFGQVLATEDAATGIQSFFDSGPGKATFVGR